MQKEILTKAGAIIRIDTTDSFQTAMLPVALAAFGGAVHEVDIDLDAELANL